LRKICWDGVSSTIYCSTVGHREDEHVVWPRVRMRIPIAVAVHCSCLNASENCNNPVQTNSNLVMTAESLFDKHSNTDKLVSYGFHPSHLRILPFNLPRQQPRRNNQGHMSTSRAKEQDADRSRRSKAKDMLNRVGFEPTPFRTSDC
jgi:hypothetical protein